MTLIKMLQNRVIERLDRRDDEGTAAAFHLGEQVTML